MSWRKLASKKKGADGTEEYSSVSKTKVHAQYGRRGTNTKLGVERLCSYAREGGGTCEFTFQAETGRGGCHVVFSSIPIILHEPETHPIADTPRQGVSLSLNMTALTLRST